MSFPDCIDYDGYKNRKGYGQLGSQLVHRLTYIEAFGPIPFDLCVLHRCDNPPCVNLSHLFLGTNKDNVLDSARKGRQQRKLTEHDVRDIIDLCEQGYSQIRLSEMFGVTPSSINNIMRGRNWGWLRVLPLY